MNIFTRNSSSIVCLLLLLIGCKTEEQGVPDVSSLPSCQYQHANQDNDGRAWEDGGFCIVDETSGALQNDECDAECQLDSDRHVGDVNETVADPLDDPSSGDVYWGSTTGSHQVSNDGSFSYAVNLETPSGLGVIDPILTLLYNSNTKNGLFGWGWSFSYDSSIRRCEATQVLDGHLSGISDGDQYKYCLDGKRLVEVGEGEYRLQEENFSRIYFRDGYWEVLSKDGLVSRYGYDQNSKQDSLSETQAWYIDREEDIFGNYVIYDYSKDAGVVLIREVRYSLNNSIQGNPEKSVRFDYEQRPDLMGGYSAGQEYFLDQRVSAVEMLSGSRLVWTYDLTYQDEIGTVGDPAYKSRIASIERCYSGGRCEDPVEFEWTTIDSDSYRYKAVESTISDRREELERNAPAGKELVHIFDVDGDGIEDGYYHEQDPFVEYGEYSTSANRYGESFWRYGEDESSGEYGYQKYIYTPKTQYIDVDINRDGYRDILRFNPIKFGLEVYLNIQNGSERAISDSASEKFSISKEELSFLGVRRYEEYLYIGPVNLVDEYTKAGRFGYDLIFRDVDRDGYIDIVRIPPRCAHPSAYCEFYNPGELTESDWEASKRRGFPDKAPREMMVLFNEGGNKWPGEPGNRVFAEWTVEGENGQGRHPFQEERMHFALLDINADGYLDLFGRAKELAAANSESADMIVYAHNGVEQNESVEQAFVSRKRNYGDNENTMGEYSGDFDGDGLLDFALLTRYASGFNIYRNSGGKFTREPGIESEILPHCLPDAYGHAICNHKVLDYNNDGMDDVIEIGSCSGPESTHALVKSVCNNNHSVYRRYSAQVRLSQGVDESGNILFSDPIVFDVSDSPRDVNEFLDPNQFHDHNNDGMLENRDDRVNSFPGNRIYRINSADKSITVVYTALDSTATLISSETLIGDLMIKAHIRDKRSQLPENPFPKIHTRKLMAVDSLYVSEGGPGQTNVKRFRYKNMLFDPSQLKTIGFERVEADQFFYDRKDIVRTVTEYLQKRVQGILLQRKVKRRRTYVLSGIEDDPTLVLDEKMQWKTHIFDSDLGDTPRYFAYQYRTSRQNWDLDGTPKGTEIVRNYENTSYACDSSEVDPDRLIVSDGIADFYDGGVPKEESVVSCDAEGEAGSPAPMIKISAERNTDVKTVGRVAGLVHSVDEVAWFGSKYDAPVSTLWAENEHSDLRNAACDEIESFHDVRQNTQSFEYFDNGALERKIVYVGTEEERTTEFTYNESGSVKDRVSLWSYSDESLDFDSVKASSVESYDSLGRKVLSLVDEGGQPETKRYDSVFGVEVESRVVQPNGTTWVTKSDLDVAGRVENVVFSDGTEVSHEYRKCSECDMHFDGTLYYRQTKKTGESATREYFDVKGRSVGARTKGLTGEFVYQGKGYDSMGNISYLENPHYSGETIPYVKSDYDVLGRIIKAELSGERISTVDYQGLKTTFVNEKNQTQTRFSSLGGLVLKTLDDHDVPLEFTYWSSGKIKTTKLNDDASTLTCMTYNRSGEQTSLFDKNVGKTIYNMNALGKISRKEDANGNVIQNHYDEKGRLIRRVDHIDGRINTHTWDYDNAIWGQLDSLSGKTSDGSDFVKEYSYTDFGLIESKTITFGGESKTIGYDYDDFGRRLTTTYPSGYQVAHIYNEHGYKNKVVEAGTAKVLWHFKEANAYGLVKNAWYGDGSELTRTYEPETGHLSTVALSRDGQSLMHYDYGYDKLGNLKRRNSRQVNGFQVNESFCYDSLNRLTSAKGCGSSEYGYNEIGNIIEKKGLNGTFEYGEEGAGPHALTSVGNRSYRYDASGNLKELYIDGSPVRTVEYSIFNKPTEMKHLERATNISYDPEGVRVARTDTVNGVTQRNTFYLDDAYEETRDSSGVLHKVHYVTDAVVVDQEAGITQAKLTYQYLHRDHLNSVVVKTSESTDFPVLYYYSPWGERLVGGWNSQVKTSWKFQDIQTEGFTGHEHLDSVGLIHMNGRVYDPVIGRFVSPDPVVQSPFNVQSYNRYSYAFNNPLSANDPTGYTAIDYTLDWLTEVLEFLKDMFSSGNAPRMMPRGFGSPGGGNNDIEAIVHNNRGRYALRCVENFSQCREAIEDFVVDAYQGKYSDIKSVWLMRRMEARHDAQPDGEAGAASDSGAIRDPDVVVGAAEVIKGHGVHSGEWDGYARLLKEQGYAKEGEITIIGHGTVNTLELRGRRRPVEDWVEYLNKKKVTPGQTVRIFSCNVGRKGGFAQQLSKQLSLTVIAPNYYINWEHGGEHGLFTIGAFDDYGNWDGGFETYVNGVRQ